MAHRLFFIFSMDFTGPLPKGNLVKNGYWVYDSRTRCSVSKESNNGSRRSILPTKNIGTIYEPSWCDQRQRIGIFFIHWETRADRRRMKTKIVNPFSLHSNGRAERRLEILKVCLIDRKTFTKWIRKKISGCGSKLLDSEMGMAFSDF